MRKYRLNEGRRAFSYQEDGAEKSVSLRQIIAVNDLDDMIAGSTGGWINHGTVLAQEGNCWTYDQNAIVFGGTMISGNMRITDTSVLWEEVYATDNTQIDSSEINRDVYISDSVTIHDSLVCGQYRIFGRALTNRHSMIITAQGLTPGHQLLLQIYGRTRVSASCIVHQAQIYDDAVVRYAFIKHRARVFDPASVEGNGENNVQLCDCAKVYGYAQVKVGIEEGATSMIRYSSWMAGYTIVEGNYVLEHHILIGGNAVVRGGPILLGGHAIIQGESRITGAVVVENHVELASHAAAKAFDGGMIRARGPKAINDEEYVTQTLLAGSL